MPQLLHLPGALEDILAEARGYRLSLVLAHQHLDQLSRDLAASASANARNKVCFTLDPADARVSHGQPITRDVLRARLGISNQLASDLLHTIRTPEGR